ncbi:hypothetical protein GGR51DRAFT_49684 [Nemania sp. FL0031]|nr:hypothetical protein GGR51DRAFT_49684 [Nemania sp. FL0031]
MHRDMFLTAKNIGEAIKLKAVATATEMVTENKALAEQYLEERADTPDRIISHNQMTPKTRAVTQGVNDLGIQDESPTQESSSPSSPTPQRPYDLRAPRRVPNTPRSATKPTGPTHLMMPASRPPSRPGSATRGSCTPNGSPRTPQTPTKSARKPSTPGSCRSSRHVRTPARCAGPPPVFTLNTKA